MNSLRVDGRLFEPAPEWSGYTTKKHLATIRQIAPKWGSAIMTYIETANSSALSYENYLKYVTKVVYDKTDDPINFMIYGEGRKNVALVRYKAEDMNRVGLNKTRFTMTFESALFSDVHVIVGMNDKYKVRIVSDPISDGSYATYECEVFGPASMSIPSSELYTGSLWSREGAPVPMTDSMKGAKTSYSSPYARTFNWSSVRVQEDVPGNMRSRPVAFAWKEGDKVMNTWEDYRTFKADIHFRELKNKTLVWGTTNINENGGFDDIDERSGNEIVQGSGIVQQMEQGNVHYYNTFDIDEFGEKLLALRVGKTAADKTHYVVSTGTYGMMKATNEIAKKAQGWQLVSNNFVQGSLDNLSFGARFTRYLHPAGFTIDFRLEPLFDDEARTPVKHPDGGYMRSHEFHVMDLGTTEGTDAVELHYVEGMEDNFGIIPGMRDPFSPLAPKRTIVSAKDAWSEHRMSQFMVVMKNPKNTLIYRPNIRRSY